MNIITVEGLEKKVLGKKVLNGISFSIEEKGVYAILGKKGAGKTTLASALAGVIVPDGGKISYKDEELYPIGKASRSLKKKIGYLPEKCSFYGEMTVFEILDFTGRLRGVSVDKRIRQIKEALELVFLSQRRDAFVKTLTDSEKKRLAMANALIGNPSVILLDEPIARASVEDAGIIKDVISMLGKMKTVIIFTERTSDAEALAENIGILAGGKIALWSSLDEIKDRLNGEPRALLKAFLAFTESDAGGDEDEL